MSTTTHVNEATLATALAEQSGKARERGKKRLPLQALAALLIALFAGGLVAAALPVSTLHALNAAGAFKGTPIDGVQNFVEKLKGNVVWLGGTAMGLVIAVVAIMFMAGHSRAHDLAIRTIAGLMILASISGIVA
jgi:hypothetical protein